MLIFRLEEIPNFKHGKKTLRVFTEALEGLNKLMEFSQDPAKKIILKRPLEEAVKEFRHKVRRIEEELEINGQQTQNDLPKTENNKENSTPPGSPKTVSHTESLAKKEDTPDLPD